MRRLLLALALGSLAVAAWKLRRDRQAWSPDPLAVRSERGWQPVRTPILDSNGVGRERLTGIERLRERGCL